MAGRGGTATTKNDLNTPLPLQLNMKNISQVTFIGRRGGGVRDTSKQSLILEFIIKCSGFSLSKALDTHSSEPKVNA